MLKKIKILSLCVSFSFLLISCSQDTERQDLTSIFGKEKKMSYAEYFKRATEEKEEKKESIIEKKNLVFDLQAYYDRTNVNYDSSEIIKGLEKSLKEKSLCAAFALGNIYYEGKGVAQDREKAIKLWTSNDLEGDELDCRHDSYQVYKHLVSLAEKNPFKYAFELGMLCKRNDCNIVDPDIDPDQSMFTICAEAAREWLEKAYENGNVEAAYQLGKLYTDFSQGGSGTHLLEPEKGEYWYKKASDLGIARASLSLGKMHYFVCDYGFTYNIGCATHDISLAIQYLKKAARQGNPQAKYMLAKIYERGEDVTKDMRKYHFWYNKLSKSEKKEILGSYFLPILNGYWFWLDEKVCYYDEECYMRRKRELFLINFQDLLSDVGDTAKENYF